jgi:PKD repeat protein
VLAMLNKSLIIVRNTIAIALVSSACLASEPPAFVDGTEAAAVASNFQPGAYLYSTNSPAAGYSTPSNGDEGAFRTFCEASHMAFDDPLIYPGQPGASHLHMFYGNTAANADSTYSSLRQSGESTCGGGKLNRSAYWHPAVLKDLGGGVIKAVKPAYATVYYKTNRGLVNGTYDHTHRIPRGMGYVFGFNMSNPTASRGFAGWKCSSGGTAVKYLRNWDTTATLDCAPSALLGAVMSSPQCWDGVNLTSPNGRAHMAYPIGTGYTSSCPASHPYRLPHYDMIVWFSHNGPADYKDWYLSSDRMEGQSSFRNGETMHTDWFGAWDYPIMQTWMNECNGLTGKPEDVRTCVATQFGDGTAGTQTMINFAAVPETSRYLDLPAPVQPPSHTPVVAALAAAPTTGPAPLIVKFDASSSTGGSALRYAWDLDSDGVFDDGSTAGLTWTYPTAGSYVATVRVSDGTHTAAKSVGVTVTNPLPVQPPVVAALVAAPTTGPAPLIVKFDASSSTGGSALRYAWDLDSDGVFDDGSTAGLTWTYPTAGSYVATVRVSDGTHTAAKSVGVTVTNPLPVQPPVVAALVAAPTTGPAPLIVKFDASSSTGGSALRYAWDLDSDGVFDDGSTAGLSRKYTAPGSYVATVRVSDGINSASKSVGVTVTKLLKNAPRAEAGSEGDQLAPRRQHLASCCDRPIGRLACATWYPHRPRTQQSALWPVPRPEPTLREAGRITRNAKSVAAGLGGEAWRKPELERQ